MRAPELVVAVLGAALAGVVTLCGCAEPAVDACNGQCDKRASCGQDIDVDQCHAACADSALPGDDACVDAQLALQRCQLALDCDAYLANTGCEAAQGAVDEAC